MTNNEIEFKLFKEQAIESCNRKKERGVYLTQEELRADLDIIQLFEDYDVSKEQIEEVARYIESTVGVKMLMGELLASAGEI